MTNRIRKAFNPVRHLNKAICQIHVSANSAAPLGWPCHFTAGIKSPTGVEQKYEDAIERVDVQSDDGFDGVGVRCFGTIIRGH